MVLQTDSPARFDDSSPPYAGSGYVNTNTNTNTKYTCDTGQTRNTLLAQWVHLTNHVSRASKNALSWQCAMSAYGTHEARVDHDTRTCCNSSRALGARIFDRLRRHPMCNRENFELHLRLPVAATQPACGPPLYAHLLVAVAPSLHTPYFERRPAAGVCLMHTPRMHRFGRGLPEGAWDL